MMDFPAVPADTPGPSTGQPRGSQLSSVGRGALTELKAACHFAEEGYLVYHNMLGRGTPDLILYDPILKTTIRVEVKTGTSGTKDIFYWSVKDNQVGHYDWIAVVVDGQIYIGDEQGSNSGPKDELVPLNV